MGICMGVTLRAFKGVSGSHGRVGYVVGLNYSIPSGVSRESGGLHLKSL